MKAILDIGKTNIKLWVYNDSGAPELDTSRKNHSCSQGLYPHIDIEGIWRWFTEVLKKYKNTYSIKSLIITTHGATAALIDSQNQRLALPVLDYEFEGVNSIDHIYQELRPTFSETLSPSLPFGLNLGKQLFWLAHTYPQHFAKGDTFLTYPQYWAWRLTGVAAVEVTSLGCHTDLWNPTENQYSSLIRTQGWEQLMPPVRKAWEPLGCVNHRLAIELGLPDDCQVFVGLHDSNASYLRYLLASPTQTNGSAFCVISSGTWTVLMQSGDATTHLDGNKDMLANCDISGAPVGCARFMGGREYQTICEKLGGVAGDAFTSADIQTAINNQWLATPDFSGGNGPFGGLTPQFQCPNPANSPNAIATLYCALMIDQRLTDLKSSGYVVWLLNYVQTSMYIYLGTLQAPFKAHCS
jgi:sugar (pentulose or hexulose) kinase